MTDELKKILEAVGPLVERARLGDQNAMGLITRIKEQADKGVKRAILSQEAVNHYIQTHPSHGHGFTAMRKDKPGRFNIYALLRAASKERDVTTFAGDIADLTLKVTDPTAAAVAMADGCSMTRERMIAIAKLMGEEKEQKLFFYCVKCTNGRTMRALVQELPKEAKSVVRAGQAVGMARKIQGIRSGKMPLARLSPMVAWELGQ